MNYDEAVVYVHSLLKFGIRPGLTRMNTLLSYIGNPQNYLKFIHIAGTNGKGSTATAMANILRCAGYKTGLYTSPYVVHFLERIQVDCNPVSEDIFSEAVSEISPYIEIMQASGDDITEFELITAAAFLCYKWSQCDVVVLEVGLGGRLDATNVITSPVIEIITSLSLDHTAILGDTIDKIAYEKCGIIKNNTTVICAPCQENAAMCVINNTVAERSCELIVPDIFDVKIYGSDILGTDFSYKDNSYRINMAGEHQIKNMISVIEAVGALKKEGYSISQDNIYNGISFTKLPARIEVLSKKPLIILDGSHNPDGIGALCKVLRTSLKNKKITVIIGMMVDKDVENCVSQLALQAYKIICVTPINPRSIKSKELSIIASKYCENVICFEHVSEVYPKIISELHEDDVLLIAGSLYLAGEIKLIDKEGS